MPGVTLAGVVDTRPGRADEIGAKYGAPGHVDIDALLGQVDAVSVAVPTVSHLEVALAFIERGISVLVEKPLAPSVADADRLITAAQKYGVVLAAGHTERFNPAVVAALPLVSSP